MANMLGIIDIEKAEYQPMNNLFSRHKRNIQWEHKYWPNRLHHQITQKAKSKNAKPRDHPNIIYGYTIHINCIAGQEHKP